MGQSCLHHDDGDHNLPQGWRQRSKGQAAKKLLPVLCRLSAETEYTVIIITITNGNGSIM